VQFRGPREPLIAVVEPCSNAGIDRREALRRLAAGVSVAVGSSLLAAVRPEPSLSAEQITQELVDVDPWGLSGASARATIKLTDKRGSVRVLKFEAESLRYAPPLAKSLVRFTAPADLAGAGFLQVQKPEGDDDRFLFLPELRRARRISGNLRQSSFMGTDFAFADLDRRDLRESQAQRLADAKLGKYNCYHLETKPARSDSPYRRIEIWVRKDNFLPLKMMMYNASNSLVKTFTASTVRRVDGHWYLTKSTMADHTQAHTTELVLDHVAPRNDIKDDLFTVRNLEKL
jgi:hypothetical protein